MLEVLKFAGYAAVGGILVFCAMRYAQLRYEAGYRAGLAGREVPPVPNARRRA
jgi:hypothetical protein